MTVDDYFYELCGYAGTNDHAYDWNDVKVLLSTLFAEPYEDVLGQDEELLKKIMWLRERHDFHAKMPYNMFEVMIILAEDMADAMEWAFGEEDMVRDFFWDMVGCLALPIPTRYIDMSEEEQRIGVQRAIHAVKRRTYEKNGNGSLFGILATNENVRSMPLIKQASERLRESDDLMLEYWSD